MNQIENFIATSFPSENDVKFHLVCQNNHSSHFDHLDNLDYVVILSILVSAEGISGNNAHYSDRSRGLVKAQGHPSFISFKNLHESAIIAASSNVHPSF